MKALCTITALMLLVPSLNIGANTYDEATSSKIINAKARSCDLTKLYSCAQSFYFSAESNQLSS